MSMDFSIAGHKCSIKNKLAELAEEVNSWEDDLRHASVIQNSQRSSQKRSPLQNACRESLVVLNLMPVSAQKARWERLMSSQTANIVKPQQFSREVRVAANVPSACTRSLTPTAPVKQPNRADVVRSSVSQAERERLERMAELAALRQARRGAVISSQLASAAPVEPSHGAVQPATPNGAETETAEFALPPPPSPTTASEVVDDTTIRQAQPISSPEPTSMNIEAVVPDSSLTMESLERMASPLPEQLPVSKPPLVSQGSCASDSLTNISSFMEEVVSDSNVQPHSYYSRPKFGTKRPHANVTSNSDHDLLPRQRSVTFAPPPGTAPGDTASEATTLECDAESILRGRNANAASDGGLHSSQSPVEERDDDCLSSSPDDKRNDDAEGSAASDSELSALLDIALEEAATEEALQDKENRLGHGQTGPDSELGGDSDEDEDDGVNAIFSDPEASHNLTTVTQELRETADLVRKSSGRTSIQGRESPGLIRGNSLRRSTSQRRYRRRQSGTLAGTLLDSDCPTPTARSSKRNDSSILSSSSAAAVSEAQRRLNRLAELPALLQAERNMILQASAALQQCAALTASGTGSTSAYPTPKRSRHADASANASGRSGVGHAWSVGSVAHVEANRMLLIACQRRQVLMEELALLHRGSSVLVPPSRGDPIRARLKMSAVRLGLKSFHKPGDPTSGGGYVAFHDDILVNGNGRTKSPIRLSQLRTCPTQYHLLAMIKCRGEGRLYHSQMVTLVPVSDLPVGTVRPVTYVDLPANIDIVPLRPDFVFTLEIYCMRVGSDGPATMQLISGSPKPRFEAPDLAGATPKSSRHLLTSGSARRKVRLPATCADVPGNEPCRSLAACLPSAHFLPSPVNTASPDLNELGRTKMTAFTLLSSVEIRYHDDLLLGRLRPSEAVGDGCGTVAARMSQSAQTSSRTAGTDLAQLPLQLSRLPRSSPLSGLVGLVNASVRLEARILTRGFLTVFEEVGGFGVWQRYWCQLRADHLQFWRYPEDEQRALHANDQSSRSASSPSTTDPVGPLGRIDLRHVAAPRAVPAPRRICARANTIFMRSLRAIDPDSLSASVNAVEPCVNLRADQQESLMFRASPDYKWLEQKHLLCADTPQERDRWMTWLNLCLEALKDWMPEHFSCLARFDARLEFSQPVSSKLAALLVHGDPAD